MATLESINRLLSVGAMLIDHAAIEIRDAKLEPVQDNVESIGKALAEIFEIQHLIYSLQPELTPELLKLPDEFAVANRLMTKYMFDALESERSGNIERAIEILQDFLELESSPLHREIAVSEIERLQNGDGN